MIAEFCFDTAYNEDDFSDNGLITPKAVMSTFQKAAVDHANTADFGFDKLIKENMIWVVIKLRYEVTGEIRPFEKCTVKTFPFEMKSITVERDYYIYNSKGELAVKGAGIWCLLDYETRRIVRKAIKFSDEHITEPAFSNSFEKIRVTPESFDGEYVVKKEDIDENDHVNNCIYSNISFDFSGVNDVNEMTILFEKEAFLGDRILLGRMLTEKGIVVICKNEKGEKISSSIFR